MLPLYIYLYIYPIVDQLKFNWEVEMKKYSIYYLANRDLCSILVDAIDANSALTFAIYYLNRMSVPFKAIYLHDWE